MTIENHNLVNEFPELSEKIQKLKTSHAHFHKVLDAYEIVTHEVQNIENAGQNTSDEYLENLRKNLLKLKDELYEMLKAA